LSSTDLHNSVRWITLSIASKREPQHWDTQFLLMESPRNQRGHRPHEPVASLAAVNPENRENDNLMLTYSVSGDNGNRPQEEDQKLNNQGATSTELMQMLYTFVSTNIYI
ncbi:unnamed protein product, partial [Brassica oleracea]